MAKLVILGSSNAIPELERENTYMALVANPGTVLVDCAGTPTVRLSQAGIALDDISDLILTHFHPDHVSGVPLLLMNMWLLGRTKPLTIHALKHCLDRIERLMDDYLWKTWPGFFEVELKIVPDEENAEVVVGEDYRILASPVEHLVPTIGLRFESTIQDRVIVYSCDTAPTASVQRLAQSADVLVHEAAGSSPGHSTAGQAGEIARKAGVGRLLLIHYPGVDDQGEKTLIEEAQQSFGSQVGLAKDLMTIDL
jgi:ribonuclease Z